MFKLCVIVLLICVTLHCSLAGDNTNLEQAFSDFLIKRCKTNADENGLEELDDAVINFPNCAWGAYELIDSPNITEINFLDALCNKARHALHDCLVSLEKKLEPCLDEKEKFLTDFISGWYNITLDEHCTHSIDEIEEHARIIFRRGWECREKEKGDAEKAIDECISTSTLIKDFQSPDFVITKFGFCRYLLHANECILEYVKENCHEELHNYLETHLKPTKIWCDKHGNDD